MKINFETTLITAKKGTLLREAKKIMSEHRIHHLPILNEQNEITSILSDRDFLNTDQLQEWPVDYFANSPVESVTTDTPLRQVALLMLNKKISSVLLIDQKNTALGIITSNDLLFQLSELLKNTDEDGQAKRSWTENDILITAGEFFRRLAEIGI